MGCLGGLDELEPNFSVTRGLCSLSIEYLDLNIKSVFAPIHPGSTSHT